jgi:signal transduction histidine kinase
MSITHHPLPDGGWADLRDPADVSERLRRPVRAIQMRLAQNPAFSEVVADAKKKGVQAMDDIDEAKAVEMATVMGEDAITLMDDLNDRLIVSRVAGWSYEAEVTIDALQDLPGGAYDELKKLCAEGALSSGPDFSPSTEADSPTGPSTASV